eukprot:9926275-Heterocapsa_arctica.AAC.1
MNSKQRVVRVRKELHGVEVEDPSPAHSNTVTHHGVSLQDRAVGGAQCSGKGTDLPSYVWRRGSAPGSTAGLIHTAANDRLIRSRCRTGIRS